MCNWEAAREICSKFTYAGKKWRLPTSNDMLNVAHLYSIGMGSNGLMLCENNTGYSSALRTSTDNCAGSYDGCVINSVWGDTLYAIRGLPSLIAHKMFNCMLIHSLFSQNNFRVTI